MTTKTECRGFIDDFGRDLAPAIWESPEGPLLCCAGVDVFDEAGAPIDEDRGYILYTPDEWNATANADLEADTEGHVSRLGEWVDYDSPSWTVPASVRAAAIS